MSETWSFDYADVYERKETITESNDEMAVQLSLFLIKL